MEGFMSIVITVPFTGISITVTSPAEMKAVFFRLNLLWDLEVNGKVYPNDKYIGYTEEYFRVNYFEGK
jgi:hypothetical protein